MKKVILWFGLVRFNYHDMAWTYLIWSSIAQHNLVKLVICVILYFVSLTIFEGLLRSKYFKEDVS